MTLELVYSRQKPSGIRARLTHRARLGLINRPLISMVARLGATLGLPAIEAAAKAAVTTMAPY